MRERQRACSSQAAVMGKPPRNVYLSIGLSPWMSSMILWRMFTVSKRFNLEKPARR